MWTCAPRGLPAVSRRGAAARGRRFGAYPPQSLALFSLSKALFPLPFSALSLNKEAGLPAGSSKT